MAAAIADRRTTVVFMTIIIACEFGGVPDLRSRAAARPYSAAARCRVSPSALLRASPWSSAREPGTPPPVVPDRRLAHSPVTRDRPPAVGTDPGPQGRGRASGRVGRVIRGTGARTTVPPASDP